MSFATAVSHSRRAVLRRKWKLGPAARLFSSLALLLAGLHVIQAQAMRGSITGLVLASDATPVPDVSVILEPGRVEVRSAADGSFTFTSLAAGRYTVIARRVGYRPDSATVTLASGAHVRVVLRPGSQMLEAVTVSALRAGLPRVFERAERGLGAVMYADEIERTPLYNVMDLLDFSPRLKLGVYGRIFYVDGRYIRDPRRDLPHKLDVAAIEVHRGYMGLREPELWLPAGRSIASGGAVVLIWTRQYVDRENRRTGGTP